MTESERNKKLRSESKLPSRGPWCNMDGTLHIIPLCDDRGTQIVSESDALCQVARDSDAVVDGMAISVEGPTEYHLCTWEGEPDAGVEPCECEDAPDDHVIECWAVRIQEPEAVAVAQERKRIARWLTRQAQVPSELPDDKWHEVHHLNMATAIESREHLKVGLRYA